MTITIVTNTQHLPIINNVILRNTRPDIHIKVKKIDDYHLDADLEDMERITHIIDSNPGEDAAPFIFFLHHNDVILDDDSRQIGRVDEVCNDQRKVYTFTHFEDVDIIYKLIHDGEFDKLVNLP